MKHPIEMGMVSTRGDDIRAHPPFVPCNLADFIGDDGRFDLFGFLQRIASQLCTSWPCAFHLFGRMKWVVNDSLVWQGMSLVHVGRL